MALLKPFRGFGVKITGGAWNPDLTPTWLSKSPCAKKKNQLGFPKPLQALHWFSALIKTKQTKQNAEAVLCSSLLASPPFGRLA